MRHSNQDHPTNKSQSNAAREIEGTNQTKSASQIDGSIPNVSPAFTRLEEPTLPPCVWIG